MRSDFVIAVPQDPAAEQLAVSKHLGVPLFLRNIFVLAEAGHSYIVCVTSERIQRTVQRLWNRYAAHRRIQVKLLTYDEATPALLTELTSPHCFCLSSNTVVTALWVQDAYLTARDNKTAVMAGDWLSINNTDVLRSTMQRLSQQPAHVESRFFCHLESVRDVPALEHFLCETIRLNTNGLVARYINKRISLPISRILARTRVHPHSITVLNMLVGLSSGIGTAGVLYISLLNGAILFQLASILDGCDGEVAKLTHRTSHFGQLIDTVSDNSATLSFFTGLMIHQYRVGGQTAALLWGGTLLAGLITLLGIILRFQLRYTNSLSFVTFDKEYLQPLMRNSSSIPAVVIRTLLPLFKKEWHSILFLLLGILGLLPVALFGTTIAIWGGICMIAWLGRIAEHPMITTTPARTHGISTTPLR